jgi:GNAT superfamily N-acetyltransferase
MRGALGMGKKQMEQSSGRAPAPGEIRAARPEDLAEVARLVTELGYPHEPHEFRLRFAAWLDDASCRVLVAVVDGQLAGVLAFQANRQFVRAGTRGRFRAVVIDPRHRGKGIGRRLMEAAHKQAAELGCTEMELTSLRDRTDAHSFFRSLGYYRTNPRIERFIYTLPAELPPTRRS